MALKLSYDRNADDPSVRLWIFDDAGQLVDFSAGYTFAIKIGQSGAAALVTKTSGITGAAGSGVDPTGTPNVTVVWTVGELDIAEGTYGLWLTCTSSTRKRIFAGTITIGPARPT